MATRSKEEVLRDIEQTRVEAERAVQNAGEVWSGNNAVASAWRSAKGTYLVAQDKIVDTALVTDKMIRRNIYTSVGIAVGLGVLTGLLTRRKPRPKKKRNR